MWHCPEDDGWSCHQNTLASPWDRVPQVRRCLSYSSCCDDGLITGERSVHRGLELWHSVRHVKGDRGRGLRPVVTLRLPLRSRAGDCSPLSPHPAQGEALPREVGLPASTDLMKEITILHRCAQRFSWVILETVKVTLLTVIFGS